MALVLSALITVSLFYVMQALIKSDGGQLEEPAAGSILDFVRVKQEEVVEQKDRKPKKPPKPKEPLPQMNQPQLDDSSADSRVSRWTSLLILARMLPRRWLSLGIW